ncbi:MAG TPA: C39 family peptidase [Caulobacteraceae bacterium]
MTRWARVALTAATAIALTAGAANAGASQGGGKPIQSLADLRDAQVVRQHWDLSCGAAAVATLFTYQLGYPLSEREAALAMLRRTSPNLVRMRLGFSLLDLKIFAASRGLGAAGFEGMTLADLDSQAPAIVPIRWRGFRHFVVYRGRRDGRVLIADPAFGNRTVAEDAFQASWANHIGFVVFDPSRPRAPNRMGAPARLFLTPTRQTERASIATLSRLGGP